MTKTEISAFTSALEQVWKNFSSNSLSSGVLGNFISELNKAVQFATELDSLMSNVAHSSDITKTQLQYLTDNMEVFSTLVSGTAITAFIQNLDHPACKGYGNLKITWIFKWSNTDKEMIKWFMDKSVRLGVLK